VPWLQIPYYDEEGRLVGVQNRNLVRGALPRFRFPQGSECGIYNLPVLKRLRPGDELWIAEGCSDCWALLSAGHKAIAIPSATLLSKKDKELLSQLSLGLSFHMYPDRDAPGERLFLQLQQVLPTLVHHQLPEGCKDFGEYYRTKH
jgi:DNA primase